MQLSSERRSRLGRYACLAIIVTATPILSGCALFQEVEAEWDRIWNPPTSSQTVLADLKAIQSDNDKLASLLEASAPSCGYTANKVAFDKVSADLSKAEVDAMAVHNNDRTVGAIKAVGSSLAHFESAVSAGGDNCYPKGEVENQKKAIDDDLAQAIQYEQNKLAGNQK